MLRERERGGGEGQLQLSMMLVDKPVVLEKVVKVSSDQQVLCQALDGGVNEPLRHTPQTSKHAQCFPACQVVQECIKLRAVANVLPHLQVTVKPA